MTVSDREALTTEVRELLMANGYSPMPSEIMIGEVQLHLSGLWQGPSDSLDLTIVADRPSSREEESRLYWIVQRLTRALDVSGSRRTVTLILVGAMPVGRNESDLLELARVLVVDGSLTTERMMGPVLRLQLPTSADGYRDGVRVVADTISPGPDRQHLAELIQAAPAGSRAVAEKYRAWIEEAFRTNRGSDG